MDKDIYSSGDLRPDNHSVNRIARWTGADWVDIPPYQGDVAIQGGRIVLVSQGWTTPLTESGWYWAWDGKHVEMFNVWKWSGGGKSHWVVQDGDNIPALDSFKCWLGPLPVPEPPRG